MSYSGTIRASDIHAQKQRQDECVGTAIREGAKSAALAGLVSGGLSQLMKHVSEAYRWVARELVTYLISHGNTSGSTAV